MTLGRSLILGRIRLYKGYLGLRGKECILRWIHYVWVVLMNRYRYNFRKCVTYCSVLYFAAGVKPLMMQRAERAPLKLRLVPTVYPKASLRPA